MSVDVAAVLDTIISHALSSGQFERVNAHEPKNTPGNGLTCSIWAQNIVPLQQGSGLNSTSGVITWWARIMADMLQEPQDAIDTNLLIATIDVMGRISGDFTLGGTVRNVDLLGQTGNSLSAEAGYVDIAQRKYRCMTITIPAIVNDIWSQTA